MGLTENARFGLMAPAERLLVGEIMQHALIDAVDAMAVLDSRGLPTVRASVLLDYGIVGIATAPSGASTGRHERQELRDGDLAFNGRGVERAVEGVRQRISPMLRGSSVLDYAALDRVLVDLDGTDDRSNLGANAIVAVSMAVCRAGAVAQGIPLWKHLLPHALPGNPVPIFNVMNGGAHAPGGLRIQECMLVPHGLSSAHDRVRAGAEIYAALKMRFAQLGMDTSVGDEGGFVMREGRLGRALALICEAIATAGYRPGSQVSLGIDAAANGFRNEDGTYSPEPGLSLTSNQLCAWWHDILQGFPVVLLEDPLAEEDDEGWRTITRDLGDRVVIVGDDIFVTDAERIGRAIRDGIANTALLKPNQIGTVSETVHAWRTATEGGYRTVVSHRSGETADSFITDLAVALNVDYLKAGAPARAERTEKYNRLLEIERELGRTKRSFANDQERVAAP